MEVTNLATYLIDGARDLADKQNREQEEEIESCFQEIMNAWKSRPKIIIMASPAGFVATFELTRAVRDVVKPLVRTRVCRTLESSGIRVIYITWNLNESMTPRPIVEIAYSLPVEQ